MHLSHIGQLADNSRNEIPKHFPFVLLDAFIIMPNHIHGIFTIDKRDGNGNIIGDGNGTVDGGDDDDVETRHCLASTDPHQPSGHVQQS